MERNRLIEGARTALIATTTKPPILSTELLQTVMADHTVAFGVPAFNEGEGVVPTLVSLWDALALLELRDSQLILCESHTEASRSSVGPAKRWASAVSATTLFIDSVNRRRLKKEAVNRIFDLAKADVLVLLDADVLVPRDSLLRMLYNLFKAPRPVAATGAALPDPIATAWNYRAGAWQLRASARAASFGPRIVSPAAPRIQGAFWGSWRSFYSTYRLEVGIGSLAEDVEIAHALSAGGHMYLSLPEAFVYTMPPGSSKDLCLGTMRSDFALGGRRRRGNEYLAAIVEAVLDPLGAALYGWERIWCGYHRRTLTRGADTEHWQVLTSTKRNRER